jgi:hypothetical protein
VEAMTIVKDATSALKNLGQKRLKAPSNVAKYDGKTNPNVWLEDYHLSCKAGGADDDQLLPIYLADSARVVTSQNFHFGI